MEKTINNLTLEEFKDLTSGIVKEAVEDSIEDILALASPEYIKSIKEARKDYKEGRIKFLDELSK